MRSCIRCLLLVSACIFVPRSLGADERVTDDIVRHPVPQQLDLEVQHARKRVALAEIDVKELDRAIRSGGLVDSEQIIAIRLRLTIARLRLEQALLKQSQRLKAAEINARLRKRQMELALVIYQEALARNESVPGTFPKTEVERRRILWQIAKLQLELARLALPPPPAKKEADR